MKTCNVPRRRRRSSTFRLATSMPATLEAQMCLTAMAGVVKDIDSSKNVERLDL